VRPAPPDPYDKNRSSSSARLRGKPQENETKRPKSNTSAITDFAVSGNSSSDENLRTTRNWRLLNQRRVKSRSRTRRSAHHGFLRLNQLLVYMRVPQITMVRQMTALLGITAVALAIGFNDGPPFATVLTLWPS
jgi:hypothetical protein